MDEQLRLNSSIKQAKQDVYRSEESSVITFCHMYRSEESNSLDKLDGPNIADG